jgi:hypothetical protein
MSWVKDFKINNENHCPLVILKRIPSRTRIHTPAVQSIIVLLKQG